MKAKWCAALVVLFVLGGCTGEAKPDPGPSAAPSVVPVEVVPAGYFRKPKDAELCKQVELAPLQAAVPGIAVGPSNGFFKGGLQCQFQANTPSLVVVTF